MSKDIYRYFNNTVGDIPQAQPLSETEVNRYMKEFRNRTNTETSSRRLPFMYKSVIAASLALVMAIGGTIGYNHFSSTVEQTTSPFIMTVNAEEVTAEKASLLNITGDYGLSLSENNNGNIYYCLNFLPECKGDNIKSVTYSLDNGTIGIVCRKDNNPVISGFLTSDDSFNEIYTVKYSQEDEEALNEAMMNNYSDSLENPEVEAIMTRYEKRAYNTVTIDYNNQNPEGYNFEIFGVGNNSIITNKDALFAINKSTINEKYEQFNKLISNIIHCTAEYNDGTTVEQDIKIGATISTFSEAFPDEYNAMPEDDRPEKDYCDVFVTFTAVE